MIQTFIHQLKIKLGYDPKELYIMQEEIDDNDIWRAIRENRIKTFKENLSNGKFDPNEEIIKYSNQTMLHQCIVVNKYELFYLALLHNSDINRKTSLGMTPLHLAASLGRVKMVEDLLERKADLTLKDPTGMTALDRAQFYEHQEIVDLLQQ